MLAERWREMARFDDATAVSPSSELKRSAVERPHRAGVAGEVVPISSLDTVAASSESLRAGDSVVGLAAYL
jgi:hypothetical protein